MNADQVSRHGDSPPQEGDHDDQQGDDRPAAPPAQQGGEGRRPLPRRSRRDRDPRDDAALGTASSPWRPGPARGRRVPPAQGAPPAPLRREGSGKAALEIPGHRQLAGDPGEDVPPRRPQAHGGHLPRLAPVRSSRRHRACPGHPRPGRPPGDGCEIRRTAMRRAGDLMAAAPHDPSGKDAHWDDLSKRMLQFLLKAAALLGADIVTVQEWASNPMGAGKAAEALGQHDPGWGNALVAMVTQSLNDERYWSAISQGAGQALAWLDDDEMAAVACPAPGEGINLREFIEDGTGTIYVIGAARPHGSDHVD